ncbi:diguanylate cyclase [Rhodococcus sp. 1168]|uniref:GGDEF domain-containing protein n=1 Tax=Rhodococcus sp. 1168 TaxID=2018041 RepID=UPI000A0AAC72|nr:GGDEF domain-containing protein [Rhodococcus sp. 1168]ORI13525.1 hypothetical protein BJI47_23155 [Rhodococcus sp. 1168]
MPLLNHFLHPGSAHGLARLQTRLLKQYLALTTMLYVAGVAASILPHGDRVTANITGGVIAIVVGVAGLVALWVRPRTVVGHRVALGAALIASPMVMAFHVLTSAQFLCLIAVMFVAMYIRAFHRNRPARVLIGVLVACVLAAVWWAPAPLSPISYLVFVVAIVGAAETFGAVTKELIIASCTDPLTGVFNRAGWEIAASEARPTEQIRRHTPAPNSLTVVAIDVDDFKTVNDTDGHRVGDAMLVELAQVWRGLAPPGTVIARLGGDEFAAMLAGHRDEVVEAFVQATRQRLSHVSVGVASSTTGGEPVAEILARADSDLYLDKRSRSRD